MIEHPEKLDSTLTILKHPAGGICFFVCVGCFVFCAEQAVELSRVKDEKTLDFFYKEVEVMRVRLFIPLIVWFLFI